MAAVFGERIESEGAAVRLAHAGVRIEDRLGPNEIDWLVRRASPFFTPKPTDRYGADLTGTPSLGEDRF
jgi:hypothetical protein